MRQAYNDNRQNARPTEYGGARRRRRRRPLVVILLLLVLALAVGAAVVVYGIITTFLGGANAGKGPGVSPMVMTPKAANDAGPPYVVALDAGHGGHDVGAEGVIQEVTLTEGTVAHLYKLLQENDSFSPVLCRELGAGATIDERVALAKEAGAALLLSVHGNTDPVYNSSGFECFPTPPGRAGHEQSLQFATLLATEMQSAGSGMRGENGVRYLYYIEQKDGSYEKMYREVSDTNVYTDKSFGILERASCPAVLAEQCYITNEGDVQAFGTESGCQKAAECYYRAICAYFEV